MLILQIESSYIVLWIYQLHSMQYAVPRGLSYQSSFILLNLSQYTMFLGNINYVKILVRNYTRISKSTESIGSGINNNNNNT